MLLGQFMSISMMSLLAFFCFMLFIRGCGGTVDVIMIGLGSFGITLGYIAQLMQYEASENPFVLHIALLLLAIGTMKLLNKKYNYVENTRR